jgi:signal peptidase I
MPRAMSVVPWLVTCAVLVLAGAAAGRAVQPVRVMGGSMRPALEPGDVVLVARRGTVALRDIVLVTEPGHAAVLHRAVGFTQQGWWVTRGDANDVADLRPVRPSAVAGRVVSVLHVGGVAGEWREVLGGATLANQSDSTRR